MATTYCIKGEEKYFTYDEIMDALENYLSKELLAAGLSKVVDIATEETKDKIKDAIVKMFAKRMAAAYVPAIGFLFSGTMTALDLYEFGKKYLEWKDFESHLEKMTENSKLLIRMDTYYWESGTSNSWSKYAKWYFA